MGRDRALIALIACLALLGAALGLWFRLSSLFDTPMWLDEAYSSFAAEHSMAFIWHVVPRYDTHPPLYYSILHGWEWLFGNDLAVRRLLGLFCGIATLAMTAAGGATLGRLAPRRGVTRVSVIAAATLLAAWHPLLIMMTQQIRPYPLMILVFAIGTLAIVRIATRWSDDGCSWRGWTLLVIVAEALMTWLHALGPLFAATLATALLLVLPVRTRRRASWSWLIGGQIAVALAYIPAALILHDQAPTWARSNWLHFDIGHVCDGLSTLYAMPGLAPALAGLALALIGLVALARLGAGRAGLALLVLALAPTLLSLLVSLLLAPVFLPRTLSPASVPMLLLMAGATMIDARWRRLVTALLLVLLLPFAWSDVLTTRMPPSEDWNAVLDWLGPRMRPGDVVWAYPNEGALPFVYAARDRHWTIPVRQIPAAIPALNYPGAHPTGERSAIAMSPAQIAALVQGADARSPHTIWLLGLAAELYDPEDRLETALRKSRIPIATYRRQEIHVVGLERRDDVARGGVARP